MSTVNLWPSYSQIHTYAHHIYTHAHAKKQDQKKKKTYYQRRLAGRQAELGKGLRKTLSNKVFF